MKHNAIARIIIYSLLIVVLSGILITGLAFDLSTFLSYSRTEYTTGEEIAGDVIAVEAEKVSCIELNWAAGSITIQTADTDQITFSESGATEKYAMSHSLKGGTLCIDYAAKISFVSGNAPSKHLAITVPVDWVCKELDLDGASLDITINGLNLLDFDIDGASNEIIFTGSLRELDCDGASCILTLNCLETPRTIDLDGAFVEMNLNLPRDCGFLVDMSGLSCDFHSDLPYSRREGTYSYGDKHCMISVDGISCSIMIHELP